MKSLLLFLIALPLVAAIDGTVVNKTTGKPQPGVTVNLTKLGQNGMEPAGSAKSGPDGKFSIEAPAGSVHLLQALYQGVAYNMQLQPGTPTTGLQVQVFDSLPKLSAVDMTQHMILVESDGKELVVNESVIFQNDSQTTWYDPRAGTLHFTAPPEAGKDVKSRVIAPGGMPVEREPKPIGGKGEYAIDFPVKPGETRFDISYKVPIKEPMVLKGRILHDPGPVRLIAPQGITVEGDGLSSLGAEPRTGAAIYDIKGDAYAVKISGTGTLRSSESAAQPAGAAPEQPASEDGPTIQQIMPPGYERQYKWALGLILAILALSFAAQYMKSAPSSARSKPKA
ncbi:carboxypeptidase-like regulatory domain-containing protein [uncultured Paludibaculum sp.]|uniref:carboxypeptidase-like regulatory domain-containing protein n=1 Tax=uncultured Paludibaculum sp. TaxID=1765020 RepID=UPI002AAB4566|nr:carboxypeptidase-like regulatory domain-containing protein [uncultured Paludibaculum sp.]